MEQELIFIANLPNYFDNFEKQKEIIERYKPIFVLSDDMENNNVETDFDFNKIMKKNKISNMTSMTKVRELVKLCHKKEIKLIGIDFENFLIDRKLQIKINKHQNLNEDEEKLIKELEYRRENKHVKMIQKYLEISRHPIVVIINAKELKKRSLIRRSFRYYHLVYLSNSKGEIIFNPTRERLNWKEEDF